MVLGKWVYLMSKVPLLRQERTPVFSIDANQRDLAPRWEGHERELFIDNLLVRIRFIIELILVDRPCVMGVWISFSREPYIWREGHVRGLPRASGLPL